MKLLSTRQKQRLLRAAFRELGKRRTRGRKLKLFKAKRTKGNIQNKRHEHVVEAWSGDEPEIVISEMEPFLPPERLCFVENWIDTISLMADVQKVSYNAINSRGMSSKNTWFLRKRTSGGKRRIKSYFDFARLKYISTAVALAITAEYDTALVYAATPPPTINLRDWDPEVLLTLLQIGFFETLGITPETEKLVELSKEKRVLKIVRGQSGDQLEAIARSISQLMEFWDEGELERELRVDLNTAIGEAMINVAKWAYEAPKGFYDDRIRSFWVTGSVDKRSNELVVVIYDRGLGIPATYSRKQIHQNILKQFSAALRPNDGFEYINDATYIKNAVKYGNSRSDEPQRGKGLPQMQEIIEKTGAGSLTIASRGGLYRFDPRHGVTENVAKKCLNGTLIEWRISLSKDYSHAG